MHFSPIDPHYHYGTPSLTWPGVCSSRHSCDGPRHHTHHGHALHCSLRVVGKTLEDPCMLLLHSSDHQTFICGVENNIVSVCLRCRGR